MAGTRINRFLFASISIAGTGIEHDVGTVGGVIDISEPTSWPRPSAKDGRGSGDDSRLEGSMVGLQPAVEKCRAMARRAQHPDQSGGDDATGIVIGNDGVVVADAE